MANASGRLINRPTSAPEIAGCIRSATLVARKPMAKRLENACKSIARDLSGCLPKTTIEASSKPNTIPHKMPKTTRFMETSYLPVRSFALYAQLLYSFAVQHKLEARWATVIGAFPIGFHRGHIFLLRHFLDSHVSVCTDELLLSPA